VDVFENLLATVDANAVDEDSGVEDDYGGDSMSGMSQQEAQRIEKILKNQ